MPRIEKPAGASCLLLRAEPSPVAIVGMSATPDWIGDSIWVKRRAYGSTRGGGGVIVWGGLLSIIGCFTFLSYCV